jgi:hypothetical protein
MGDILSEKIQKLFNRESSSSRSGDPPGWRSSFSLLILITQSRAGLLALKANLWLFKALCALIPLREDDDSLIILPLTLSAKQLKGLMLKLH